jgi:hypothetical protein
VAGFFVGSENPEGIVTGLLKNTFAKKSNVNYPQFAIEPRCSQLATPHIDRSNAPFDRSVREFPIGYTGVANWLPGIDRPLHRTGVCNRCNGRSNRCVASLLHRTLSRR